MRKFINKTKKKLLKNKIYKWLIAGFLLLFVFNVSILPALASDKNVSSPTTFASLDGSAQDDDGTVNGVFTVNGNLMFSGNGSITCNDTGSNSSDNACPIKIAVSGNMSMDPGTFITAENNFTGGSGGNVSITVGGNILLKGPSGATPGAKISSARTTTGGSGNGGDMNIFAGGSINFEPGTIVSAADLGGGKAGDIYISSGSPMDLNGLISAGPSNTVLATKLTGFVLERGNTTQRGGKISIACTGSQEPGVTVSTDGVIVSQGEDPASDTITVSGCGIEVYGLVASVSKKSNGSNGNSPQVILKSGDNVLVNGTDLGSSGPNQGKIRADYVIGEDLVPQKIDIFAKNDITILGPSSGSIYALSSNGGNATNQKGGTITLLTTDGKVTASGLALQAFGGGNSGSMGGTIDIQSKLDVDLSNAKLNATGATTGGNPDGGHVTVKSYSQSVLANSSTLIDVTGGSPSPEGTVNLTACGTIAFPPGVVTPVSANKTTGVCSPDAPSLPQGVVLPVCNQTTPTPTETISITPTESLTPTPSISITPTPSESITPTPTESITPTPYESTTPTPTGSITITPTPTESITPTPGESQTPTPTPNNQCPQGQVFDPGLNICIECNGGGTCEVTIGSPTPTPTTTSNSPTPTPTQGQSNGGSTSSSSSSSSTSNPTQAVLGASTLAGTGDFIDTISDILLFAGIIAMVGGFFYGQKKVKKTK